MRELISVGALLVAACGGDDGVSGDGDGDGDVAITIADHPDPLTNATGDLLFTLSVDSADVARPISMIELTGKLAGETGVILRFDHDDANGDGLLDAGETLTGREPPSNLFDVEIVGQDVQVDLNEDDGTVLRRLVGGIWTPAN